MQRLSNPPNPYESSYREYLEEPPLTELEVYEDNSQTILSKNESPDLCFTWSLNPYRGCMHGCAYCLSGDTPIAMADGRTTPLADVRVGDEIYGTILREKYHYFVKTRVLAHWSVVKPAYRVTLENGAQFITSGDHRFLTNRGWKYVIGTQQGRTRRPHLTTKNKLIGIDQFTTPPNAVLDYQKGYLCGMIRGDGLLGSYNYDGRRRAKDSQYQFRLALIDPEPLQRAQRYLSRFGVSTHEFLFQKPITGYRPMHAIRTNARSHVERVNELIQWPMESNIDWHKGFLAGIFDAEGSYSCGVLRICNTSTVIINSITDSLRRLSFDYAIEKRPREKPIYNVRVRGGLGEHLRFFHTTDPAITRKKNIAGQAIKNRARLRVSSVEALRLSLPLFDMTTGTGDFIANGVVSHNCYARPTHEYLGFGSGTDFQTKIVVKPKAPELLRAHFLKKSWKGELILFSGNTDCYQPLEASWQLTRRCLEVCLEFQNPVSIITKSYLVTRDIDLLKELDCKAFVQIFFSIPFLDEEVSRRLEPFTATPRRRFEAMKRLSCAGLKTGISLAPLIPGLNDADMPRLLKTAKESGASSAFTALLRLPGNVKSVFLKELETHFPLKAKKVIDRIREVRGGPLYNSNFFERQEGQGNYWDHLEKTFEVYQRKFGLDQFPEPPSPSPFRVPSEQKEFAFF
ncbi:MAG: radical SAM protein [Candidatus Omnitrophica bacterium]|nr:radical SAM protein [Candidatus Omnitrophota bacterium]